MENRECYLVYLSEFTARFCTWSILSQLLMYLISIHWKTESDQLYIVGASISLLYMSAIFGGLVKDWLLPGKQVVILGIGLISIGLLFLQYPAVFYGGLSLTLVGAGMVTPNTPLLLSSLEDAHRDKRFTILYGVTNAGVILGSVFGGIVNGHFYLKGVIILNELIILVWFVSCFFASWLATIKTTNRIKLIQFIAALLMVAFISSFYLKFEKVSEALLIIASIIYLGFLFFLTRKLQSIRKELLFSISLILLAIVFFSAEFQVASTLIAYAHHFVALNIAHMTIPAGSLLALESVFVVIGAFCISRIKFLSHITSVQTKVFIGLILGALAFVVLYSSTGVPHPISVLWIIFASLLLGFGDVCLMPPVMAYVTKISPAQYKGRLVAGMYFSLSLSGYLSGLMGSVLVKYFVAENASLRFYSTGFSMMISMLGTAAVLVLIIKIIAASKINDF